MKEKKLISLLIVLILVFTLSTPVFAVNSPGKTEKQNVDSVFCGSVKNVQAALQKIRDMEEGQTAILDCRDSKIASKTFFQAVAGKNKTLVFEDENIQWIFQGKKIKLSRCKDIDLKTTVKCVSGKKYGYPDDKYILYMKYADNGLLPGEAEMRVNYDELLKKYNSQKSKLVLSYYDKGEIKVMSSSVKIAQDKYVEYRVTHNSTYILSKNSPRLLAPSFVKASARNGKEIRLSWGRVAGACGYEIYRSSSSRGSMKKIASVKGNNKTSYTDKKIIKGKKYYYRIKAKGVSKGTKAAYSKKVSCKVKSNKRKKQKKR